MLQRQFFTVLLLTAMEITCTTSAHAQFSPAKVIGLSTMAQAMKASGDIDADGDIDMIAAGWRNVVLFVNDDGLGTFTNVELILDGDYNGIGGEETLVFMLDVDSDGAVDVVVQDHPPDVASGTGGIQWVRNLGNAVFAPPITIPDIPINGKLLGFEDIDSDGDEDMLLDFAPPYLHSKENLGNGLFGPEVQLPNFWNDVRTLDLDGDDNLDLLEEFNGNFIIHRGNGDGTFTVTLTDVADWIIRIKDANGDGFDDLLGIGTDLYWRRGLGDGTFAPAVAMAGLPLSAQDFGFVDMNADGAQDLLIFDYLNLQGALNLGDYTFGPFADMAPPLSPGNSNYEGELYFCDIDNAGVPELFVNETLIVREFRFPENGTMEFVKNVTDLVYGPFSFMGAMDFNNDGMLDVVHGHEIGRCLNGYARQASTTFDQFQSMVEYAGRETEAVADMDNDGDDDLVLLGAEVEVLANDGAGAFALVSSELVPGTSYTSEITAHDVDGDGDQDLLIATQARIRILRNNGGNNFTLLSTSAILQMSDPVVLGFLDVDNDGDQDMITQRYQGTWVIEWVRNDGALVFGARTIITGITEPDAIDIADADLDGDLDIFSFHPVSGYPQAFLTRNLGNSTFAAPTVVLDDVLLGVCSPRAFDADGDGDPDLVVPMPTTGGSLLLNDGTGSFGPPQPLTGVDIEYSSSDEWKPIDMDGDGDLDILYFTTNGINSFQRMGLAWSENFFADPYHLSGTVFVDADGDGALDGGEIGLAGAAITATPTGYFALGNGGGEYMIYSNEGSQTVAASLPSPLWSQTTTPLEYTVSPSATQPDWPGLDFGFQPTVDISLIHPEVVLASAPCSATTSLWITAMNEGTRIEDGTISLALDNAFTFVSSDPTPSAVSGNMISWTFSDLSYFGTQVIHASVVMPGAQSIGDPFTHAITITTVDDQGDPTGTFLTELNGVISCAYDPNDKLASPEGYGGLGAIDISTDHIDYTIRFQNTGNAPAVVVVLRDQLDADLDLSSLRILGFSHEPTEVVIEPSGELIVRFNGIQLPDSGASFTGSQGFIKFRLDLLPGLPHLTPVHNTAEIYFDLNDLVLTNTALRTLVDCALWQPTITPLTSTVLEATEGDLYQWYLNGDLLTGANGQTLLVTVIGDYTVSVTSLYGCAGTTPAHSITTLGLADHERPVFALVPNPMTNEARLFLTAPLSRAQHIEIVDIYGRILQRIQGSGSDVVTVGREGLAAGIYVLLLKEGTTTRGSIRMIVE